MNAHERLAQIQRHYERTIAEQARREQRRFTLDGEPVDLEEFFAVNNDPATPLQPEEVNAIARLSVGESLTLGGGAGAEFILKREG